RPARVPGRGPAAGGGGGTCDPLYPSSGSRFRSVLPGRSEPVGDRRGGGSRPTLRLHPGVARLQQAILTGELGAVRGIRHECPANPADGELARTAFPRMVDVVRALLGEIEALTASGDPP